MLFLKKSFSCRVLFRYPTFLDIVFQFPLWFVQISTQNSSSEAGSMSSCFCLCQSIVLSDSTAALSALIFPHLLHYYDWETPKNIVYSSIQFQSLASSLESFTKCFLRSLSLFCEMFFPVKNCTLRGGTEWTAEMAMNSCTANATSPWHCCESGRSFYGSSTVLATFPSYLSSKTLHIHTAGNGTALRINLNQTTRPDPIT